MLIFMARPPDETTSEPPLEIVPYWARPPENTISEAPLSIVTLKAVPPEKFSNTFPLVKVNPPMYPKFDDTLTGRSPFGFRAAASMSIPR